MIRALASLAVVAIILRCLWLWQPERQLLLHQAHFREALERRDWRKVQALVDARYSDRWGFTRDTGLAEAREWLGQFIVLTVIAEPAGDQWTAGGGRVTERWRLDGMGGEMVKERVNAVHAPFVFEWKHGSWKPWDWTLIRIDNPELEINAADSQ